MPWLIDGNNVAGGRDREAVRRAALDLGRRERLRIVVVFDGAPPPGTRELERLGRVEIRYAHDADAAILDLLATSGPGWRLASDDRELGRRAADRGARVVPSAEFWSKVRRDAGPPERTGAQRRIDVGEELRFLRDASHRLDPGARRIPRRRRKK